MTSTKPPVVLPLDVRLLVMDSLPELSFTHARLMYTTFRACALTCRAWLPYARRRLYNAVQLATPTDCELFSRTIGSCPDLAILVERIDCRWNCDDDAERIRIQTPLPSYIVNRLLSLKLARFSTGGFLATVPFVLFIKSFATCPQLRTLSLYDLPTYMGTATIWSLPSITHLQIRACPRPQYEVPALVFVPPTITELDITTNDMGQLDLLLKTLAPTIRILHLRYKKSSYGPYEDYDGLQYYKCLEKLEITCEDHNLPCLIQGVSRIGASALKEVTFVLIAHRCGLRETFYALDEVFCKPPYLNLERLHVICRPPDPQPPDDGSSSQGEEYSVLQGDAEQWAADIEESFPNCHTRGILTIDVEMRRGL